MLKTYEKENNRRCFEGITFFNPSKVCLINILDYYDWNCLNI